MKPRNLGESYGGFIKKREHFFLAHCLVPSPSAICARATALMSSVITVISIFVTLLFISSRKDQGN